MKFSIVTISLNQMEFLERTILSVIRQEGIDFEYIIVDPGSTDGSREIIERYREHFVHVVYEKDQGPAHGLNRGFELATGDVYCYLNSDDTYEPDVLRRVARFLREHSEFDVVCGHAWVIDRCDNRLRRVWSEPFERLPVAYGAAVQVQPSTFIRREAFLKAGGFNIENKSGWDAELLDELYLSGSRIGIINEFLSNYRLHAVSITNSGRLMEQMIKGRDKRYERLLKRPRRSRDIYLELLFRLRKHVCSPKITFERIMHGPIFNRGVE